MHPAVTQVTKHQSAGVQSKTLHLLFANIFINLKSIHIFSLYDHKVFYVEILYDEGNKIALLILYALQNL